MNSSKIFVIITTVIIVLLIIFLVFMGSLCQYFRNPGLYQDEGYEKPTPKSAFESIFSSHRTLRNDLYYLDLNMKNNGSAQNHLSDASKIRTKREITLKSKPPPIKSKSSTFVEEIK